MMMTLAEDGFELTEGRLWPNTPSDQVLEIEIIAVCGELSSGKTIFGLSIAPGVHPEDHKYAGMPRTAVLDLEKSSATYADSFGCHRIDVPDEMMKLHGKTDKPYTAVDVFLWFAKWIEDLEPGRFDVVFCDPVTDIEGGQVDYIKQNPTKFNLTANQVTSASGLLWPAVKDDWKRRLLTLASKCQTFCYSAHMRQVWVGNSPTKAREPQGKDVLAKLASVYLLLDRTPLDGKMPDEPSAIVMKSRLADTTVKNGKPTIMPLLPGRMPVATVHALRQYIAKPPSAKKPKKGEKVPEKPAFTEEEMANLALDTAEAEKATSENRLALLELQCEKGETAKKVPPQQKPPADAPPTAEEATKKADLDKQIAEDAEKGKELAADNDGVALRATAEQVKEIQKLWVEGLGYNPAEFKKLYLEDNGKELYKNISAMPKAKATLLVEHLRKAVAKKK